MHAHKICHFQANLNQPAVPIQYNTEIWNAHNVVCSECEDGTKYNFSHPPFTSIITKLASSLCSMCLSHPFRWIAVGLCNTVTHFSENINMYLASKNAATYNVLRWKGRLSEQSYKQQKISTFGFFSNRNRTYFSKVILRSGWVTKREPFGTVPS